MKTRIGLATAKEDLKGWPKGEQKEVVVAKMSTGRICIYKDFKHRMEPSGYKTYDSIEGLEKDFYTDIVQYYA